MSLKTISELFKNHHLTLGSVESFTGGLFASEITSVPGASSFFKGGIVTYATEEKADLLDIPYSLINEYGVVSKQIAEQMAIKGKEKLNVDCCVSFTGNAGPSAMEGKPVGEVYIGVSYLDKVIVNALNLSGTRDEIRCVALQEAYKILENLLCNK